MLGADQRMRRRDEFTSAIRDGRRARQGCLVVHLATAVAPLAESAVSGSTAERAGVRVGFVVPRAVGGAVVRNTVRRRLRHLLCDRLAALPDGSRLVVRVLPGAAEQTFAELGTDLDAALAAAARRRTGVSR